MTNTTKRPKVALARQLRKTMTEPEVMLWYRLKDREKGLVFKRQKAYGPYILDFYCFAARLAIEVDGATHWEDEVMARDKAKDAYLIRNGLHVRRIAAEDVYDDADEVAKEVWLLAEQLAEKRK
jgi:very-short-patch-repair endonuclease